MKLRSAFKTIAVDLEHFGLLGTLHDVTSRAVNQACLFKILKILAIDKRQHDIQLPEGLQFERITADRLRELSVESAYEITEPVLEKIETGGECFGIFAGSVLTNYLCMTSRPTAVNEELEVRFDRDCAYLSNLYTLPAYRGRHLSFCTAALANNEYLKRGYRAVLAYVESQNKASLRALGRAGMNPTGTVMLAEALGKRWIHVDSGCRPYSFTIAER